VSGSDRRLLLDGVEGDEIEPGGSTGALGHDPFADAPEPGTWPESRQEIEALLARAERSLLPRPAPPPEPSRAGEERPAGPAARPAPPAGPRSAPPRLPGRPPPPPLDEIDPEPAESLLEQLVPEMDRRRLAALAHLVDGDVPYDRFGLSPEVVRRSFPFFLALHRYWFRVASRGHAYLPATGPVVLAANHAGLLPFDGAMTVLDVLLHTDPPRLPRAVVDRWAGALPWVNVFFARMGQVIGTRENFADLLDDGQMVLVFPEGMAGARKRVTQRYRLQAFHPGFVEQALRARAPIVPMAVVGSDDQTPILFDFQGLARRLGLPSLPVTPTFPWLGPLGLLPYPVRYRIVYGEPLPLQERFGPEAADDARLVRHLSQEVRRAVQLLLDRNRA